MQAHNFEPMSTGGILDRTFKIYKNNFVRFITIVAIIQIPIALLTIISTSVIQSGVPESNYDQAAEMEQDPKTFTGGEFQPSVNNSGNQSGPGLMLYGGIGIAIVAFFSILGQVLSGGALAKSISESYLGNELSVGEAYRYVLPKLLTIIAALIFVALVVGLGLVLLVVPGIIFMLWFSLTTQTIVIENLKATKGMSRSKALASGNLGKIFSVGFLIMLITWVASIPLGVLGGFLGRALFHNNVMLSDFINQLSGVAGQILVAPIGAIAYTLLYYDLRIRKEGFDLQMLASSIGSSQRGVDVDLPQQ